MLPSPRPAAPSHHSRPAGGMVISGYGSLSRRLLQSKLPYRFVHRTRNSFTSVSSIPNSLLDHHWHDDGGLTTASLIIRYGARSPDAQPCRKGERLRRQKLCRGLRAAYPETIFHDRVRHVMGMWDRGDGDGPLHGQDRGEPQARAQPRPRV